MTKKELSRRIFDEIYSRGQMDRIEKTHDDHVKLRDPSRGTVLEGPEEIRRYVTALRTGFPDFTMEVENQIEEDDWVASVVICHGTHEGSYLGLEPTGKKVHVRCTVMQHFEDDRVTDAEVIWDLLGLLNQVGLRPATELYGKIRAAARAQTGVSA